MTLPSRQPAARSAAPAPPAPRRGPASLAKERLAPGPSARGFEIGLYLEHLEEASFLYDQRLALLDDEQVAWPRLQDFEDRLEAHLDALVLGADLALAVCRQQAPVGDFGELYAAVAVACRHRRLDIVLEMLDDLALSDRDRVRAAADALCHELPDEWHPQLAAMSGDQTAVRRGIANQVAGFRRVYAAADHLLDALGRGVPDELPTLIWALGRLRERRAAWPLYELFLQRPDEGCCAAITVALLRMGEVGVLRAALKRAHSRSSATLAMALGGDRSWFPQVLRDARDRGATSETVLAIGLLGDVQAVDPLIAWLSNERTAGCAATALYLMTGAYLCEPTTIHEVVLDDELFDDERADAANTAMHSASQGAEVTRLSRDPAAWSAWWGRNASRFHPLVRYRGGTPHSVRGVVETLAAPHLPRRVRELALDELVTCQGQDIWLETDMFVADQAWALARIRQSVAEAPSEPGGPTGPTASRR